MTLAPGEGAGGGADHLHPLPQRGLSAAPRLCEAPKAGHGKGAGALTQTAGVTLGPPGVRSRIYGQGGKPQIPFKKGQMVAMS